MCLVNTTNLERTGNSFVTALHGMGVLRIKRTSLLIDHDSILFQRIITVSIKFSCKQAFRRTKRIGRIHNNKVIFIFTASDKFQCIFIMKMHSPVIKPAGISRKISTAGFHYHGIHLYQINMTNTVISCQFTYNSAVSCSDYKNIPGFFVNSHRYMGNHFVINKFVTFREHYIAIQCKNPAKFRCLKNINSLIVALP